MRILYVIDSLRFGGAERQLVELIKGIIQSTNFKIHVVCLSPESEGYTSTVNALGIEPIYILRSYKFDLINPIAALAKYIKENQIDLVHTFMNLGSIIGLMAAKLTGRPVISSAIRDAKDASWKAKISKKLLARFADILVSNSKAGLTNRFKKMKPNFSVVYNGIDLKRFDKIGIDNSRLKKELGIDNCEHVVGMVASLSKKKDHYTLFASIPAVLKSFPKSCFLLIGNGQEFTRLKALAKELGIFNNIIFAGYRKDVDRLYHFLDVLILLSNPSAHQEGISNALLEGMAVGVPVIASEGGGTNELITNDLTGILVPPKDPIATGKAIIQALGNRKKSIEMAHAAKKHVEDTFSLNRYVYDYLKIYQEMSGNSIKPLYINNSL